jgi:hypothetical protein
VLASGSLRDEYASVAVVKRRRDDKEMKFQPYSTLVSVP